MSRAALGALILVVATMLGSAANAAAAVSPEPRGRFVFTSWEGPPLPVWYQLPEVAGPDTPVIFVMHGVNRDADRYRNEWAALARSYGFILVVPEFGRADFPGSLGYNNGYVVAADGTQRPRAIWSFAAIEPLFDAVRARFGTEVARYTLYGHSAGAQFVHRFVMFMPQARIEQAIAANAGWYTMPDAAASFPYGLGGAPVPAGALAAALGQPLTVLLGTADTDTADQDLRSTREANRQGLHRFARGQSFFAAGRAAAERAGVPFGWRMEFVAGVGHSNGRMAGAAARLIAARPLRSRTGSPDPRTP